MRIISAIGGSAVLSIGAGSLADIYASHERGRKLGIYYVRAIVLFCPALSRQSDRAAAWSKLWYSTRRCSYQCQRLESKRQTSAVYFAS